MLSQFSIENFRSFKQEQTLDLIATKSKENTSHLIEGANNENYLPLAILYGPNGGGKSNFLKGLAALINKVVGDFKCQSDSKSKSHLMDLSPIPFKLDNDSHKEPVKFDIYFLTDLAEYHYNLWILNNNVIFEKLERIKNDTRRRSLLFTRTNNDIQLKGDFKKLKVSSEISKELPVLTYLFSFYSENKIVKDIKNWFLNSIEYFSYGNSFREVESMFNYVNNFSKEHLNKIINILTKIDISVDGFELIPKENGFYKIITKHKINDKEYSLDLLEESEGTIKLFFLLSNLITALEKGSVIIIDELDANIHPVILRYLIELFSNKETNKKGAQLIFSSHDLLIMDPKYLRRDEIWFVAKSSYDDSVLYSLAEFKNPKGEKTRSDAIYYKQYLEGKYGADPYLTRMNEWV